jgi:transcription initiation factor TFIID subunit 1
VINEPITDGQDSPPTDMKIANWRVGPARLWYDQIGLNLDTSTYDYGFKLKQPQLLQSQMSKEESIGDNELTGNTSLPVNLIRWEDDIIFDSSILRDRLDLNTPKIRYCGWVPTTTYRSLASFQKSVFGKNVDYLENANGKIMKFFDI